jgi:hypothetical protein
MVCAVHVHQPLAVELDQFRCEWTCRRAVKLTAFAIGRRLPVSQKVGDVVILQQDMRTQRLVVKWGRATITVITGVSISQYGISEP